MFVLLLTCAAPHSSSCLPLPRGAQYSTFQLLCLEQAHNLPTAILHQHTLHSGLCCGEETLPPCPFMRQGAIILVTSTPQLSKFSQTQLSHGQLSVGRWQGGKGMPQGTTALLGTSHICLQAGRDTFPSALQGLTTVVRYKAFNKM